MSKIKVDFKNSLLTKEEILEHSAVVEEIDKELNEKSEDNTQFLGWLNLPSEYDKEEYKRIKKCAEKIKKDSDILLVIGIGGSYLGARAVIESVHSSFQSMRNLMLYLLEIILVVTILMTL